MAPFYRARRYGMHNSIGYLVHHSSHLILPQMEHLFDDQGLTFSQWTVLMALREWRESTAAELARGICHDAGSLTRMLDQLEKRGLVTRTRSQTDRRVVALTLTAKGRALLESMLPRVVDFWNGLLCDFHHGEIRQLIGLLKRLAAAAEGRRADGARRPKRGEKGRGTAPGAAQ